MKLYMHPVSNTSRPVRLFIAEHKLPVEEQVVDLFTGEHYKEPYIKINPNHMVPMLEDGDLRLGESSAILKYLADKAGSPAYPKDLRQRARVNERMDWLNTGFYRDFGYGLIYPQVFPHLRRADETVQAGTVQWGRDKANAWLKVLDETLIGPANAYLCGNELTIADYFGAAMLTLGEVIHLDYSAYPNISRWLANMKAGPNWAKVNEPFYQYFVGPYKDQKFQGL